MAPHIAHLLDPGKLCYDGDFPDQVTHILLSVRLSQTEVDNLKYLLRDLQSVFQKEWPGCEVQPFGSIVTGLGIKTSDIDCFVMLPRRVYKTNRIVMTAKNILSQYSMFGELFAIPQAKVPIVKLLYYPTNTYCDINFMSAAGVRNSQLIAYFLDFDSKILELAVLIKYWAKVHKCTGTNLMSNYALTLLVIFYLQQEKLLPPVYELQENIEQYFVGEWNTAFRTTVKTIKNDISLYNMLGGFFEYYSMFNFNTQIVSPFLGRPVNRVLFNDLSTVPHEFSVYNQNVYNRVCTHLRTDTIMCIQDPFEHDRNCSLAVYPKLMKRVISDISFAAKRYREEPNNFLKAILFDHLQNQPVATYTPKHRDNMFRNRVVKREHRKLKNTFTILYQNFKKKYKRNN